MKTFLIVSIILSVIGILIRAHWLCSSDRDWQGRRIVSYTVGEDACLMVFEFAWLFWMILLIAIGSRQ